jgi:hypothetical protein
MAEVFSLAAARDRFAKRRVNRAELDQDEPPAAFDFNAFSAQLIARWRADADTWPRPFREAAHRRIANWCDPASLYRVRTDDDQGVDPIEKYRSGRERGSNLDTLPRTHQVVRGKGFHEITVHLVRMIRAHAAELRRRRVVHGYGDSKRSSPNGWVGQQRMALETAQSKLLAHLWLHGRRSIQREDMEAEAFAATAGLYAEMLAEIKTKRAALLKAKATLRERAEAGGDEDDRGTRMIRSRARGMEASIAALEARVREIETEPDLLVAWGLYVRVHRAPEASL